MKDKVGTMSPALVWAFAAGAILLGVGGSYALAGLGSKVTTGFYFGVFAASGFLSMFLTRSGRGLGILAFVVAALVTAGVYYFVSAAMVAGATDAMATGMGAKAVASQAAAGVMGSMMGIFVAVITLLVSLIASIGGVLAGAASKRKALAA